MNAGITPRGDRSNRIVVSTPRRFALALIVAGLVAAVPTRGHAQFTCNASMFLSYVSVPTFDNIGSIDRIRLTLGTGSILNGTTLTLNQVFFDLACRHKGCSGNPNQNCTVDADCGGGDTCVPLLPGSCVQDTNNPGTNTVMGFAGNITTTCRTGGNTGSQIT
jgi:hypothetical protein